MTSRRETYDIGTGRSNQQANTETGGPASWPNRLRARVFAGRYDQQIEDGLSPLPGSPLDLHGARLVSARERNDLARALRHAVRDADSAAGPFHPRVRVASDAAWHAPRYRGRPRPPGRPVPGPCPWGMAGSDSPVRRERAAVPVRPGHARPRRCVGCLPPSDLVDRQHRSPRDTPGGKVFQRVVGARQRVSRRGDRDAMTAREVEELPGIRPGVRA